MEKVKSDKTKQVIEEIESWRRMLDFVQSENNYLKNRIAQVVSCDMNREMLVMAEDFQARFINLDEMIRLLKKDVNDIDSHMTVPTSREAVILPGKNAKLERIRMDMELLAQQFNKLRSNFQHFILENFW